MTQQEKEQISKLRANGASFGKIASALGISIYADEAYSGTKDDRPRFMQLIQDCKDGKIDRIILTSADAIVCEYYKSVRG